MNLKILVATNKKYWMPKDSVYTPIQVGAEGHEKLGYIRDNIGENISKKNANYCELTGLYWAWKNLECDYIGLCHYRRYFTRKKHISDLEEKKNAILDKKAYEKLLSRYDIILPAKRNYYIETVRSQYEHAHYKKDLETVEEIIKEEYPNYAKAFEIVMARHRLHIYNMFVMKKSDFDAYCQWLFSILHKAEEKIDITGYSPYEARIYGFLAERLFNVWLEQKQFHTVEVPVVCLEKIDWPKKIKAFLKRKFLGNKK